MYESNMRKAMEAGGRLGVKAVLSPKEMSQPDVEHLAVMAYATHLQFVTPRPPLSDMIAVHLQSTSGRVGEPMYFRVDVLTKDVDISTVRAFILSSQDHLYPVRLDHHGEGTFTPEKYGMHEIIVEIGDDK